MFENIPRDILQIILEYDGRIKYRNGKYMNQIEKTDSRYDMLKNITTLTPFKLHYDNNIVMGSSRCVQKLGNHIEYFSIFYVSLEYTQQQERFLLFTEGVYGYCFYTISSEGQYIYHEYFINLSNLCITSRRVVCNL